MRAQSLLGARTSDCGYWIPSSKPEGWAKIIHSCCFPLADRNYAIGSGDLATS